MTCRAAPATPDRPAPEVRPALRVGAIDDPAERDADAVADRIMSMPAAERAVAAAPSTPTPPPTIRRACACGGSDVEDVRRAVGDEEDDVQMTPAAPTRSGGPIAAPIATHIGNARGGGAALPRRERAFFEPRLGADLSSVRVHADSAAADLSASLRARAFTVGQHIFFGRGEANFGSPGGRRLLAHELAHTRQNAGERTFRRWAISGDTAMSDAPSDTLGRLAIRAGGRFNDWKCIRPLSMRTSRSPAKPADFDSRYERYVQNGDTFDISNLTATTGTTLRLYLFDDTSEWKDAEIASQFYPGAVSSMGPDGDIDTASSTAGVPTPISDFVVFGHAGGATMWGAAGTFTPSNHVPEDPAPLFPLAQVGLLPRRCWFTRNATARAVGCNSNAFATDFAAAYLRRGASVVATTASVSPFCVGLPNQISTLFGNPTGCAWYNQLAFTATPAPGSAVLDGPFSTVAGFHGSGLWATTVGAL